MLQTAMSSSERAAAFARGPALSQEAAALRPVVRAVVACILGERVDHPDVEDSTHEALRRALEGQERLRDGEALRPWLLGIARHVAIDARRRRRRERRDDPAIEGDPSSEIVERLIDPAPTPDERAVSTERSRLVAEALRGLSESQREALLLFHVEGQDYRQISARLGVPMGTVATWLARGRRALAEALAEAREGKVVGP
jgi:RNA polymerase sigma factor (sigma-70 family)